MTRTVGLLFLLISLACVRAKLPDLTKICEDSDSCDMAVKTTPNGTTFKNFKVTSKCLDCLDADIGDDKAIISCKVEGCYSSGDNYELARYAKDNPTINILDKPMCDNPTAENIAKLTIGCTIEHDSDNKVDITISKLKASPDFLLKNERLCMTFSFVDSQLLDETTGQTYPMHKVTIEPHLQPNCVSDTDVDKMILFEFKS